MILSIGKVSKMFGVSRTTLLYYDKIGLFSPSSRSASGYRLYDQSDIERLKRIFILKNAGVPLNQINSLLTTEESIFFGKLIKRLGELNSEIGKLKDCQKQIVNILNNTLIAKDIRKNNGNMMDKIIRYAEINSDKRSQWHVEFKEQSPELHDYFLSVLGLNDERIKALQNKFI